MQAFSADDDYEVVWAPVPDTSQELALSAPCHHILLTGGRGWGKTELQLMRFRMRVGLGYGAYWRGIIFDQEYKNLDDLVMKSRKLFRLFGDGAKFLEANSSFKWVWPTGEELLFRQAKRPEDYWSYHGHEYAFVGWNELTKYDNIKLYRKMMSINRTGFDPKTHTPVQRGHNGGPPLEDEEGNIQYATEDGKPLPPIPLEVVSTTNPYGPGHNWVKREFIDPAPYGKIVKKEFEIFDPKTKQDIKVVRTQVTLFGSFKENPFLTPEYIAGLYEETDENILKAWIKGDWDIVAGGALDDKWRKPFHVVPRFRVPSNWTIDRAMDWGSTHPYSVGWFAESNGEEVKLADGTVRSWAKGTIIQIAELYGTKEIGTNVGVKMGPKELANLIKTTEINLMAEGWIASQPQAGPADNQIDNVTDKETETIAKRMGDVGIRWTKSDKAKGSRKNGLQLIRDRLEATTSREGAGLVFMDNCRASIATIPILPRDEKQPDDVDTKAEDHAYDMVRYRVLKGNDRAAKVIRIQFPH